LFQQFVVTDVTKALRLSLSVFPGLFQTDMALSFIKKKRVKEGKHGDSLFVFNKTAKLWKPRVLAIRSPTGLAQMKGGKQKGDSRVGYPKLTPEKKKKIEGLSYILRWNG